MRLLIYQQGVRGRVVRVDLESLAPHRYGFESHQRLLILSCDEAFQLAYIPERLRSSSTCKAGRLIACTVLERRKTQ